MTSPSVLPPATVKQPSRKGKKAWRKNVDISAVQQGLEDVRDEITKGGIISEKPSDELFVVDTGGDETVEQQQRGKKLLRADEILAVRSVVPGLDGRKRKAEVTVPLSNKRQKDGKYISHKELQRLQRIADGQASLAVEVESVAHDPWAVAVPVQHAELDFVQKPKPIREPKGLRRAPAPLTSSGKALSAVPKPQGGKSYNPLVGDWSALLEKEGEAAVVAEKARLAAERAEEEKEARIEAEIARVEAAERDELATDYESEWDGFMSESEKTIFTAKPQQRKTPAERNKAKARKEREARELMERKQKERDAQQSRIKQIARELSARDKARAAAAAVVADLSSDSEEDPELAKRRFGRVAVPSAPLEVVLPDELQDSLRRLKPEGNLLTDRYRNHLINGRVEVRKRRGQRKQRKGEVTEKWTYKDWSLK